MKKVRTELSEVVRMNASVADKIAAMRAVVAAEKQAATEAYQAECGRFDDLVEAIYAIFPKQCSRLVREGIASGRLAVVAKDETVYQTVLDGLIWSLAPDTTREDKIAALNAAIVA
jgi:hypothetical protein